SLAKTFVIRLRQCYQATDKGADDIRPFVLSAYVSHLSRKTRSGGYHPPLQRRFEGNILHSNVRELPNRIGTSKLFAQLFLEKARTPSPVLPRL
ncbi:MAG: hypothetical protein RRY95_06970, partial [Oscillospiraceae bacterium]